MKKFLRLTNIRIISQTTFLILFILSIWASWITKLSGYPVSRLLEIDVLVFFSTILSTGFIYKYLGWSVSIIFLTLLFGRVFCNWICPFGTIHQFFGWLFNINNNERRQQSNRYKPSQSLKYSFLIVFLVLAIPGSLQIGLLDPLATVYRAFTVSLAPAWDMLVGYTVDIDWLLFSPGSQSRVFTGSFWIGSIFTGLVALNLWMPRFFCRYLCPTGAILGILSHFSIFRIARDVNKCTDCNLCLNRCEGASQPHDTLKLPECLTCFNCLDDCPEDALSYSPFFRSNSTVEKKPDFSRRQLVFAGITGLIAYPLLKNNGRLDDQSFSPLMIRPPGSIEESEFLKKCIKCDECIRVCPTNVLQPATFEPGGFESLWTPVLNFKIGHCQLKCNLCSIVCPTGAIREITVAEKLGAGSYEQKGPIRLGTAFINKNRCLPWANQIPCVVCEEVCPVAPKAIQTFDEEEKNVFGNIITLNKPFIVPDLCIGCGICQAECPVSDKPAVYVTAIGESRSDNRRLLLKYRNHET